MFPELLRLNLPFVIPLIGNKIILHTYSVMVAIGFIFAFYMLKKRIIKYDINKQQFEDILFISIISGIIGARLFFVFVNWNYFKNNLSEIYMIWNGGIVFYGGAVTGMVTGILLTKIKKLPVFKLLDLVTPALVLGHAFGRLGCLMFGCCFGKICVNKWYSIRFPRISPAFESHLNENLIKHTDMFSLDVAPAQIISSLFLFILSYILIKFDNKLKKEDGQTFFIYLLIYSVFRFIIEFYRDEYSEFYFKNLTYSQLISLGLFVIAVTYYIKFFRRKKI